MDFVNKRSYYKRALPSPPAIAFSSQEGRAIFTEALQVGTMTGFFKLIEQFTTQEEPQYCGLAALSMTLNALGIDPRRMWKGAWRWFSETMLDCCKSMEEVKRDGITLNQAACLARCNGADVSVHRHGPFDGYMFRRLLREACSSEDRHMVVSYSRKTFRQSGDGHFSPIGGYHPGRDLVLILDVARFKYAPHWVRVDDLMEAMSLPDPATGRPRGFMLLSRRFPREPSLFSLTAGPCSAIERQPLAPRAASSGTLLPSTASSHVLITPACASALPALRALSVAATQAATTTATTPFAVIYKPSATAAPDTNSDAQAPTFVSEGVSGSAADDSCEPLSDTHTSASSSAAVGSEPAWAAALRFVTIGAPELIRQLLSAATPVSAASAGDVRPEDHGDSGQDSHSRELKEGPLEVAESRTSCSGATAVAGCGGGSSGVPGLEELVGALVAAAPVESVCALLTRRRTLSAVGETREGPCCGCLGCDGDLGTRLDVAPAVDGVIAPCNSKGCCRGNCGVPLTEAAVAAAAAVAAGATPRQGSAEVPAVVPASGGGASSTGSSSDAGWLEPAGPSQGSLGSSLGSTGSGTSALDSGSSSIGSSSGRCCHGEALEHHCVPPQVQAMVADELRFTNMFKLVRYCLRRHRGCPHVQPPDITAFMGPSGGGGKSPAAGAPAAAAGTAASTAAGPAPGTGAACECGDLGLPELAAEKLATLLLLLPADGDCWPSSTSPVNTGGDSAVRVCGRPECRRCRQRAAAAGDRAAALAVLRERWGQTLRLAPLGLFGSVPVLAEEMTYIRLQLSTAVKRLGYGSGERVVAN